MFGLKEANNIPKNLIDSIKISLKNRIGNVNSIEDLKSWIDNKNKTTHVSIIQSSMNDDSFWFYDDYKGEILNRKRSFFSIIGMRYFINKKLTHEQPIILQNEIGFLGIIAKEIDGVLNFLMQAKIEPGNVNCVQISPTLQATKSNFTRAHGGRFPYYFELFENYKETGVVIYDQIQSEQSSRFSGKRNRNIILLTNKDITVYENYRWMTLGQIREFMKIDNLVNMDTRTVLSGIFAGYSTDMVDSRNNVIKAYSLLNNYKMYNDVEKVYLPLNQLSEWSVNNDGIVCQKNADFEVRHFDICIENREIQKWSQPLFKATNSASFVLFSRLNDTKREFLISLQPEIGSFDKTEFGPTLQYSNEETIKNNNLYQLFCEYDKNNKGKLRDVILSEEGGRFYHEQNRNVILDISDNKNITIDENKYIWLDYNTLNILILSNNVLNIQLRNLMSLIELEEDW